MIYLSYVFIDLNCFLKWAMWPMGLLLVLLLHCIMIVRVVTGCKYEKVTKQQLVICVFKLNREIWHITTFNLLPTFMGVTHTCRLLTRLCYHMHKLVQTVSCFFKANEPSELFVIAEEVKRSPGTQDGFRLIWK